MLQTIENEAYTRLQRSGLKPSVQRIAIMEYLLTHFTHPTIDEVYQALCPNIPTLSKTTVYNTLKLFSDHHAAQMITIDNHRVCYDGNIAPHVHFYCKECARVIDMFDEEAPHLVEKRHINGNIVDEMQLYYKGICADCQRKKS